MPVHTKPMGLRLVLYLCMSDFMGTMYLYRVLHIKQCKHQRMQTQILPEWTVIQVFCTVVSDSCYTEV